MKFLTDPILKTSKDVGAFSARLMEDGLEFAKSSIGSLPIFAGTKAYIAEGGFDADETHYLLIPFRPAERGYVVATQRVLPEGVGPENDLEKRRVFHLPKGVPEQTLEDVLEDQLTGERLEEIRQEGRGLAERLEAVAEEIDKKSNVVTGGLLLIGGAVAIANPLVGAGIAAKALIPGVGSVLSREGLKMAGGLFRGRREAKAGKKAERIAEREVQRLRPELFENPLLGVLENALGATDAAHDPHLDALDMATDVAAVRIQSITAGAIFNVYEDVLKGDSDLHAEAGLHAPDLTWLASLKEMVVDRNSA